MKMSEVQNAEALLLKAKEALIEEKAKAIFFKDMVDGIVSQHFYDVWEVETEPNVSTGEKIIAKYETKAKKELKNQYPKLFRGEA